MTAKYIWESGSIILVILGSIHLYYTFFTNKFSSKNLKLVEEMKSSFPILTNKTTMWKAWIGFNASHSSGAIFIGLINFYLAAKYFPVFHLDHVFFLFNILTIGFYLGVAKKYWFGIPFIGILIISVSKTLTRNEISKYKVISIQEYFTPPDRASTDELQNII